MSGDKFRYHFQRVHYVYRALDADGRVLYVGQTRRPKGRYWQHKNSSEFFQYTARWRVTGPLDGEAARDLEVSEIARHDPPYNRHHRTPGREFRTAPAA